MADQDLKWYSTFVFLVGSILSFADPVTDILTLVEFHSADHKIWFGVGLTFVILPCLPFAFVNLFTNSTDDEHYGCGNCAIDFLLGFNPFSAAFARLKALIFCLKNLKKLWKGEPVDELQADLVLGSSKLSAFFEAILESIPQFIIQLYAMSVQEESVKIIQMISLPVSFLSLVWTFTVVDQLIDDGIEMNVKHKVLLFVSHVFQLSSRLFAICFFIVGFKWWIVAVLMFHSIAIFTVDLIWCIRKSGVDGLETGLVLLIFLFCHWLRDEFTAAFILVEENGASRKGQRRRVLWLSNVLFVAENLVMILLFYFSQQSYTWYSLPVTICACLFSVLGAVVRIIHYSFLIRVSHDDSTPPSKAVQPEDNSVQL